MIRRLLWVSLLLVPLDVSLAVVGVSATPLFVLSAVALVPLAWLIGEATEQAGGHTGPAVAGLLNASFGNAPELIVSLFAVDKGLFEVVRGSLTGSVVGNLLLVLGCSLLFGGRGRLNRRSHLRSLGLVAFAAVLFLIPSQGHAGPGFAPAYALPVAGVLLAVYLVVTAYGVARESRRHRAERAADAAPMDWSLPAALGVLGLATIGTVAASQILTDAIETFAADAGLSDFFVAAVIVAIVGNAAEHGGAVVIAARGNVDLAAEIAFSSSAQVALLVIPLVVFASLGLHPLPLAFTPVELLGLAVAVVVPGVLCATGRSSRWRGAVLCAAYAGMVGAFYAAG